MVKKINYALVFSMVWVLPLLLGSCFGNSSGVTYEFTTVRRGTLERTVSSSGTIHPVSTIRILPQMSGKVEKVFVDFNDTVQRGDVLAELNTDMLRLRREQQYAAVLKARANYRLQLISYNNQASMAERNLISEFELLTSRTNLENLEADLAVAEATLRSIDTEINQFAYITSPIDGIVFDRRINEGDSVSEGASGAAASIFVLAENFSEMQIEANIGELDVASIYRGQAVRFTLESLPGRRFNGVVENIRMVPVVINNLVNYTVIIRVDNHDGSLMPGMTCSVEFIVARSENTLLVPNGALRYQPTALEPNELEEKLFYASLALMDERERAQAIEERNQALAQEAAQAQQNQRTGLAGLITGGGRNFRVMASRGPARAQEGIRNLWYFGPSGGLEVVQVRTGIITGTTTEILPLEDLEGWQFILRERL
ncbi:MAG: efflux RND transporter periplasmic adaptor subunit [Treponema sp.]|nr:efflux RND transporter periplasmic adaptor subunit [Treponema sp.]